ncbi:MAG: hypothetical protein ACK4WH_12450, partial [Phycisphaerales bacterium]
MPRIHPAACAAAMVIGSAVLAQPPACVNAPVRTAEFGTDPAGVQIFSLTSHLGHAWLLTRDPDGRYALQRWDGRHTPTSVQFSNTPTFLTDLLVRSFVFGEHIAVFDGSNLQTMPLAGGSLRLLPYYSPASGALNAAAVEAPAGIRLVYRGRHNVGYEAFVSSGASGDGALLRDIVPGAESSSPVDFVSLGGRAVFFASTPETGREPWSTDGTPEGTIALGDLNPGAESSRPSSGVPGRLLVHADRANAPLAFFIADVAVDGQASPVLFQSDGTRGGTQRIDNVVPAVLHAAGAGVVILDGLVDQSRVPLVYDLAGRSVMTLSEWSRDLPSAPIDRAFVAGDFVYLVFKSGPTQLWSIDTRTRAANLILAATLQQSLLIHDDAIGLDDGSLIVHALSSARALVRAVGATGVACTVSSTFPIRSIPSGVRDYHATRERSRVFFIAADALSQP